MSKNALPWVWMLAASLFCVSCREIDDVPVGTLPIYDPTPYALSHGDLPEPVVPADNPLRVQGVELGRMLFYEKRMSRNGTISCASCHVQANAFSDIRQFSLGVDSLPGKRQAMATVNLLWNSNEFFWDGRAHLLRDQALKPIQDHLEMDETLDNVVAKLGGIQMYKDQFMRAFGSEEVTALRISLALEQFMHSIVSSESKYDKFLRGELSLSADEERGRVLFFAEYNPFFPDISGADCQHCHSGKNFENDEYINNGLDPEVAFTDLGREDVTANPNDRATFKVPSLRNVALTPPYMHDGRFQTLEEVVEHYDNGIEDSPTLHVTLRNTLPNGLQLSMQDKADLVAFLRTLTDQDLVTNPAYGSPFE
ncbi:MAG TPA: cytochrome c peroxidase [Bacteroidia bacterium]|nr:cytochrome c peroxidase [Bacteroidia bacterium]